MRRTMSRALLTELLVVAVCFIVVCAVMVQMFAGAMQMRNRASSNEKVLYACQTALETMYASEDEAACLADLGFTEENGVWTREQEGADITVALTREWSLCSGTMTAVSEGKTVFEIEYCRYIPKGATP